MTHANKLIRRAALRLRLLAAAMKRLETAGKEAVIAGKALRKVLKEMRKTPAYRQINAKKIPIQAKNPSSD